MVSSLSALRQSSSIAVPAPVAGGENATMISVDRVTKRYRGSNGEVNALEPVSFEIKAGEFVSIIGPSGCGKSTLLMILSGLTRHSSGAVTISDRLVDGPHTDLGIVFQQDVLLDWRTALQNVMLQADIRGLDKRDAQLRARELLKMVGLEGFENMYPHELSGGMRQRVAICRALLHKPPLLLMDEPFGALDALTRDQLNLDLERLGRDLNITVVFVTHSIPEAVFLSDRVIIMSPRPGRIQEILSIDLPRPRRLTIRETAGFSAFTRALTKTFEQAGVLHDV